MSSDAKTRAMAIPPEFEPIRDAALRALGPIRPADEERTPDRDSLFGADNIATLDMSVVFPVSYVAPHYVAGYFQMTRSDPSGTHTSELPEWSVTEVYEKISPRF